MTSSAFVVSDLAELLAMQRVFREAKFCTEADDDEVSDSPTVAKLFERLMAVLMEQEATSGGQQAEQRWKQWLAIDESRDEWAAALRRAGAHLGWKKLSHDERAEYVKVLLCPFILTTETLNRFIAAVNSEVGI